LSANTSNLKSQAEKELREFEKQAVQKEEKLKKELSAAKSKSEVNHKKD